MTMSGGNSATRRRNAIQTGEEKLEISSQEVVTLSEQMLAAALNGDRQLLDSLLERMGGDADVLGTVANSVGSRLAENGVSAQSPVGRMVGALCSEADLRIRLFQNRNGVLNEFGLFGDQIEAIDLDDQDLEAIQGASYTNP